MVHINQHISTRNAQKHVFYKTPLNHQQNPTAHKPANLTTNILLSDVFPSTPLHLYQTIPNACLNRTLRTATARVEGSILKYVFGVTAGGKCETRQTFLDTGNSIAHLLCLINATAANLLEVFIYVALQSNRSEETIRKQVIQDLQDEM
jgi:hypothetical protein